MLSPVPIFAILAAVAPPFGLFDAQVDGLVGQRSIAITPDGEVHTSSGPSALEAGSLSTIPMPRVLVAFDARDGLFALLDRAGDVVLGDRDRATNLWTNRWTKPAAFPGARGIAIAEDGAVWIADTDRHRIVRLDPDGNQTAAYGERGAFPGLFNTPSGIDVHGGEVFVADTFNHRVVVLDAASGTFNYQWGMHAVVPREGEGKIHYPEGVAVAPDGSFVAVLEPFERRYQRFTAMPEETDPSGTLPKKLAVESHFGQELGVSGDLLVLHEPESGAAMVFDLRLNIPIHVTTFGRSGTGRSQFGRITSIAIDHEAQELWFLDAANLRLTAWRLDRDRTTRLRQDPFMASFVRSISYAALEERIGDGFVPKQLSFVNGSLELLGEDGHRLAILSPRFEVDRIVALEPEFPEPVAVDRLTAHSEGGWVVIGSPGSHLAWLDSDGGHLGEWVQPSQDRGSVQDPSGLAVLADGTVVVSDRARDRLVVIGENSPLEFGETGAWDGALWQPGEVHPFKDGLVVVVDRGNHRAQVFDPRTGEWSLTFSLGMGHDTPRFFKDKEDGEE